MPFYLVLGDLPELKNLPKAERKMVLKDVMQGNKKLWGLLAMLVPMSAILLLGHLFGFRPGTWQYWVTFFVAVFAGSFTMHQVWIHMFRSDVRNYVARMSESREPEGG